MKRLLMIDDDLTFTEMTKDILVSQGWEVDITHNSDDFFKMLKEASYSIALVDLQIDLESGIDVLKEIRSKYNDLYVFMCTAFASVSTAVEAIKLGAIDYFIKPLNYEEFIIKINKTYQHIRKEKELLELQKKYNVRVGFEHIIGNSLSLIAMKKLCKSVLNVNVTVLITGETGTGKELIAKSIHYESNRKDKPFVIVNCATLDENLLSSELFGHEKGSFTGAIANKPGKFEIAEDGTIFLDEVGEIPLDIQKKILRVLQENEYERVGSNKIRKVHCRVIAATNRNLKKMVEEKTFREDLFFRLNVFPIGAPSLKERKDDIPSLIQHFVLRACNKFEKKQLMISNAFINSVIDTDFPGNIRELEHFVDRLVILSTGNTIENENQEELSNNVCLHIDDCDINFNDFFKKYDRYYFTTILKRFNQNVRKAAEFACVTKKTIYQKIKEYDLRDKILDD